MAQARVNMPSLMKVDSPLPSLAGATAWLNGTPNPRDIKGHPILIHFWSISSETAKANLSQIAELREQWRREGLRVVGVHVPNSQAEKEAAAIRNALERFNLTEPCALDNDLKLCKDFENNEQAIPAYYLFDIDGKLNTSSTAEDGLVEIEDKLEEMLLDLRANLPFNASYFLIRRRCSALSVACRSSYPVVNIHIMSTFTQRPFPPFV
jgi:thiol-disulfide isomerase/thioredoxin